MSAEKTTQAVGNICVVTGIERQPERRLRLQRQPPSDYANMTDTRIVRFFADQVPNADIEMNQGLIDNFAFIPSDRAHALRAHEPAIVTITVDERQCFIAQNRVMDCQALLGFNKNICTHIEDAHVMPGISAGFSRRARFESRGDA